MLLWRIDQGSSFGCDALVEVRCGALRWSHSHPPGRRETFGHSPSHVEMSHTERSLAPLRRAMLARSFIERRLQ